MELGELRGQGRVLERPAVEPGVEAAAAATIRPQLELPIPARRFQREAVSIAGIVADARTVGLAEGAEPHLFTLNAPFCGRLPIHPMNPGVFRD